MVIKDNYIKRATGKTTRLIDSYIQELYNNFGQWVKVYNHPIKINSDEVPLVCTEHLVKTLMRRVASEHLGTIVNVERRENGIYLQFARNLDHYIEARINTKK